MSLVAAPSKKVVVRFQDHRLVKGATEDFHPDKPQFHVRRDHAGQSETISVSFAELKAVFFVRTFEGDRNHARHDNLDQAKGQGRKIEVVFKDGEILRGFTVGYNRAKPGFFVIPADPESNNTRVYVINAAVQEVHWR